MSEVKLAKIDEIREHPNADRLEIAFIGGWQCVISKDSRLEGEEVIYCPPETVIPEYLHKRLNITDYLAQLPKGYGDCSENERPTARRVKASRIRGEYSYGIILDIPEDFEDEEDELMWYQCLSDDTLDMYFGISKYEPIVKNADGEASPEHSSFHKYVKIKRWGDWNNVIGPNESCVLLEKADGKNCRLGAELQPDGSIKYLAGSHNLNRRQFSDDGEETQSDYWKPYDWFPETKNLLATLANKHGGVIILFCEIIGPKIQNLDYGLKQPTCVFFDICVNGDYIDWPIARKLFEKYNLPYSPILYRGPINQKIVMKYTNGPSKIGPSRKGNIREGIIIRPEKERNNIRLGRTILKSVSVEFLGKDIVDVKE